MYTGVCEHNKCRQAVQGLPLKPDDIGVGLIVVDLGSLVGCLGVAWFGVVCLLV